MNLFLIVSILSSRCQFPRSLCYFKACFHFLATA